jgi:Group 4 capsule polysaccharide lipoprotein gfcB, YjbF
MGKILEMKLGLVSILSCTALLSACATPLLQSAMPLVKSVAPLMAAAAGGAAQPSTPTILPSANAPKIWLTLSSRGIKFPMSQIASRDGVKVFASVDGSQVFLKSGILIGTRGFGRDLMSAQTMTLANLKPGSEHSRDFYDMDGTDTMIRHSNTCIGEAPIVAADAASHRESCASDIGTIHNEFWLDAGKSIIKSKQWISQGVGYAIIEPKTD